MRNRFNSLIKRIVSSLSAAAMLIGNAAPIASFADEPIEYAHTIRATAFTFRKKNGIIEE